MIIHIITLLICILTTTLITPVASPEVPGPERVMKKPILRRAIPMAKKQTSIIERDMDTGAYVTDPLEEVLRKYKLTDGSETDAGATNGSVTRTKSLKGGTRKYPSEDELMAMPCADLVRAMIIAQEFDHDAARSTGKANWNVISRYVFEWFKRHGAVLLRTSAGDVFMYFRGKAYRVTARDKDFIALLHDVVKVSVTGKEIKILISTFANLAYSHSKESDMFSWLHTDFNELAIYVNLNNPEDQIARMTPGNVEILQNGNNPYGIFLVNSKKIAPIHYVPGVGIHECMSRFDSLITRHLTCAPIDREFLKAWIMSFLLMDLSSTRPHGRFQGSVGSGKTTASKFISTLLFGAPQQKIGTMAANYSDAAVNPLVILDNVETTNIDKGLISCILTCCTAIGREKRKPGTLNETITEYSKCLINTNGIEPFAAHLTEIMTRTFIFEFDIEYATLDFFSEAAAIQAIRAERDIILSSLFHRTAYVLDMIRQGYFEKTKRMLNTVLGDYSKRRCNDYVALMYMMYYAEENEPESFRQIRYENIGVNFQYAIESQEIINKQLILDSNSIACCIDGLFSEYVPAFIQKHYGEGDAMSKFEDTYGKLNFQRLDRDHFGLVKVSAVKLHVAMKAYARRHGIEYTFRYASQLGQRIKSEIGVLSDAGYIVDITQGANNLKEYTITPKSGNRIFKKHGQDIPLKW